MHPRTSSGFGCAKRRYDATAALMRFLGVLAQGILEGESGHEHPRPTGVHFRHLGVRCEARCILALPLALGCAKRRYDATAALMGFLGVLAQGILEGESGQEHPRPTGVHFKSVGVRCEARCILALPLALGCAKRRYDGNRRPHGFWGVLAQGILEGESGHEHPRPTGVFAHKAFG